VIRRAVAADIPDLARVHVEAWRQTYAGHVPDALLAPERVAWRAAMWTAILAGGEGPHLALVAPTITARSRPWVCSCRRAKRPPVGITKSAAFICCATSSGAGSAPRCSHKGATGRARAAGAT
jgi:hypothetical protein